MKIGVSAFAWTAQFTEGHLGLIPALRPQGIDVFEVPMFEPRALPVLPIRQALEACDLECTVCAILPPGVNPISPDAQVREQALAHLRRCVDTAAAMGAHLMGGPVYAPIGYLPGRRRTGDEWSWAVECMQRLGERLEACEMTLAIEPVNRSESHLLNTAADAKAFCQAVGNPRIGVTVDTFHANIEEKNIAHAAQMLGSALRHVHVSENDRGLLGTGHVDFPTLLAALEENQYEGCLMIEGFGYLAHEPAAPGYLLASPSVSPEDIATGGAAYLRGLLANLAPWPGSPR